MPLRDLRDQTFLIIIPRVHSSICGLRDHANIIKKELECIGIDVKISVWKSYSFPQRNTSILLEFTPLSYSRFGISWLLFVPGALLAFGWVSNNYLLS